jgi:cation transport ATPase
MIKTCIWCEASFETSRSSALYCCDSHKTLTCRLRKNQAEAKIIRQQQQAQIAEIERKENERKKELDDRANDELVEQKRIKDEESNAWEERRKNNKEQLRNWKNEKQRKDREKREKKAEQKRQFWIIGGAAVIGIAVHFYNQKGSANKEAPKPDIIDLNKPDSDKIKPNIASQEDYTIPEDTSNKDNLNTSDISNLPKNREKW